MLREIFSRAAVKGHRMKISSSMDAGSNDAITCSSFVVFSRRECRCDNDPVRDLTGSKVTISQDLLQPNLPHIPLPAPYAIQPSRCLQLELNLESQMLPPRRTRKRTSTSHPSSRKSLSTLET